MEDALAHAKEDGLDAGDEFGWGAEHECEGSGGGADDAAGHGGVDEVAAAAGKGGGDDARDGAGGGGVDSRAVDEEARLGAGREGTVVLEEGVVRGLDVLWFGEAGDDRVLCGCENVCCVWDCASGQGELDGVAYRILCCVGGAAGYFCRRPAGMLCLHFL